MDIIGSKAAKRLKNEFLTLKEVYNEFLELETEENYST
jgi:hypothetical protein